MNLSELSAPAELVTRGARVLVRENVILIIKMRIISCVWSTKLALLVLILCFLQSHFSLHHMYRMKLKHGPQRVITF